MNIITPAAKSYVPISVNDESTVVAEHEPENTADTGYESEAQLEQRFIEILQSQAYEYLPIHTPEDLENNLRAQLEKLNDIRFTTTEWRDFFTKNLANPSHGIVEKAAMLHEDNAQNAVQVLKREDGTTKNITLLDRANIHNNTLQVTNQYATDAGNYASRYDVTVLVNGLPMVQIELKRRGVDIKEAFNQINRYQRDSFWADSGLFEYVQIFVISNGTHTKYYSNTVRHKHVATSTSTRKKSASADSFEFTSWWADGNNKPIKDLTAFTKTFFAKHSLLNILTKYCIFTVDKDLMVMRPYQIVATERILQRINTATNYKHYGTLQGGGYIWHTTGSGKTLTSFKTAQLATRLGTVDKVLFIVDRKDLDYQTMKEYDSFEKGAANSNTSTKILQEQLEDPATRIIITTIQKLATFIAHNKKHPIYQQHLVMVFDECHRSQFGDMHTTITKNFKKYHLFGFTGTPIFTANAGAGGNPKLKTTQQAFGDCLHTYTIVDAIADKNVLPFRVEYHRSMQIAEGKDISGEVYGIKGEEALRDPRRITAIIRYILEHYDQKTKRNQTYSLKDKRLSGFNSILATASIDAAKQYYTLFQKLQEDTPEDKRLKVAMIYSFAPNEEADGNLLAEEGIDTNLLSGNSRQVLEDAVQDYNDMFGTSYDTGARFENYYKDLSKRLKTREVDLVIVVNMFLTGFDSKTINTLWVDKNLKSHGLIQAFSRTNRILNSVKSYGNIVCFRNLEDETNDALALFGNKDAKGTVLLKSFDEYMDVYLEKVHELQQLSPDGANLHIVGEQAEKDFIKLFGSFLRLRNILTAFDEFAGADVISPRAIQNFQSVYLDLHHAYRDQQQGEKESIAEDVVFEIELIKQTAVGVDYILMLVEKMQQEKGNGDDIEVKADIERAIKSSPMPHAKKELIEDFIKQLFDTADDVQEHWKRYLAERSEKDLAHIIEDEKLNPQKTRTLIMGSLRRGRLDEMGKDIASILPPIPRFSRYSSGLNRSVLKQRVTEKLRFYIERYEGLLNLGD